MKHPLRVNPCCSIMPPVATLHARTEGNPCSMVEILQDQAQALAKTLPIFGVNTISRAIPPIWC